MTRNAKRLETLYRAVAILLFSATAPAYAVAESWNLAELMNALAGVPHAQVKFTETKYLTILNAPLISHGTLNFVAPATIEKHVLQPVEARYAVNGDMLVVEQPQKNIRRSVLLSRQPIVWGFVEAFRATLAGDRQALERFYTVSLSGKRTDWSLLLEPRRADMRSVISQIRVQGRDAEITTIETTEPSGDRSVMALSPRQP